MKAEARPSTLETARPRLADAAGDLTFGDLLREARESRHMSLGQVAAATKIPRSSLEALEKGETARLPGDVFVRGFIRSYARAIGVAESEALGMFDKARGATTSSSVLAASLDAETMPPPGSAAVDNEEGSTPRRAVGFAVFVIILLLIATITLSLLLRHPPPSGEGLSQNAPLPSDAVETIRAQSSVTAPFVG